MNNPIRPLFIIALLSFCFIGIGKSSHAEDFDATQKKIELALADADRPEKDVARDKNR